MEIIYLDDGSYAIQLAYSNMTNGRNAHIILLPGIS
jgi:hypothetical protein